MELGTFRRIRQYLPIAFSEYGFDIQTVPQSEIEGILKRAVAVWYNSASLSATEAAGWAVDEWMFQETFPTCTYA